MTLCPALPRPAPPCAPCPRRLLGRIVYFNGYATGDPKARYRGGWNHFGSLGLLGLAISWSVELLKAKYA